MLDFTDTTAIKYDQAVLQTRKNGILNKNEDKLHHMQGTQTADLDCNQPIQIADHQIRSHDSGQ